MKKHKLLITIPLLLLLCKACKPDKGCFDDNQYKYQFEEYLNLIPYKDFSELIFINKTTRDTSVFIGQGYVFDWGKYVTPYECPQTYNLQRRYIVFNCTKNTDIISIENTFINIYGRAIIFSFNNKSKSLSHGDFLGSYQYDSINIENKIYSLIRDFSKKQSTSEFGFLYSKDEGLIRVIQPITNDTLDLIDLNL
jgi:hypothetical protein